MPDVALTFQVQMAKFSLNLISGRTLSWRSTNLKRHCLSSPLNVIFFWFPVYLHWIFYPQFIKAVGFSRQICHMLQDASRADKSCWHHTRHVVFLKIWNLHQICRIIKQRKVLERLLDCFVSWILALITSEANFHLIYAVYVDLVADNAKRFLAEFYIDGDGGKIFKYGEQLVSSNH